MKLKVLLEQTLQDNNGKYSSTRITAFASFNSAMIYLILALPSTMKLFGYEFDLQFQQSAFDSLLLLCASCLGIGTFGKKYENESRG